LEDSGKEEKNFTTEVYGGEEEARREKREVWSVVSNPCVLAIRTVYVRRYWLSTILKEALEYI